jgi:hypothetical protein
VEIPAAKSADSERSIPAAIRQVFWTGRNTTTSQSGPFIVPEQPDIPVAKYIRNRVIVTSISSAAHSPRVRRKTKESADFPIDFENWVSFVCIAVGVDNLDCH